MQRLWIYASILLAVIWTAAAGINMWVKAKTPTPEKLVGYVESNPLDGRSQKERSKVIEETAEQLNGLGYEKRQEIRVSKKLDSFFKELTPDEQSKFLDLTLPEGFKQMMDALNKMEPDRRKRFVERALKEMKENQTANISEEDRQRFESDEHVKKIVDQGLKSFYSEASAETKMDLAPLIEEMQRNIQRVR